MSQLENAPHPDQVDQAIEVLAAAFADDPFYQWFMPQARGREQRLQAALAATAQGTRLHVIEDTGRITAVMAWHDPQWAGTSNIARPRHYLSLAAHALRYPIRVAAANRIFRLMLERRRADVRAPLMVLDLIAVDSHERGKGVGAGLLRALLARADTQGFDVHVETTRMANLSLYSHFGFSLLGEPIVVRDAPPTWCLRRQNKG